MPKNKIITEHYIATTFIYTLLGFQKVQTNLTLIVGQSQVLAAQVAVLGPRLHLLQLIPHS